MGAVLDMNSNRIINVGTPVSGTDVLRLVDISNIFFNPAGLVPTNGALTFDTVSTAHTATISSLVTYLWVAGFTAAGDGGGALYLRASAGAGAGKFQSADGAWWQLASFQRLYADMFGARGDGSTDDATAINNGLSFVQTNLTSGGTLHLWSKVYKVNSTVTVLDGTFLEGDTFNANMSSLSGTQILVANTVTPGVQVGTGATNNSAGLIKAVVNRVGTPISGSGVGILVKDGFNQLLDSVGSVNQDVGFSWKSDSTTGITCHATRLYTGAITGKHVVIDTWPELFIDFIRLGANGSGDKNCTSYVTITGGGLGGSGPNGIFFSNFQFNQGTNAPTHAIEFVSMSHTDSNALEFKFEEGHIEGVSGAIIYSDSSCSILNRFNFSDVTVNCPTVPMWALNVGTQLGDWKITDNLFYTSTWTLAPTSQFSKVSISNNTVLSAGVITVPTNSTISLANNDWGGLAISGAGNISISGDTLSAGSFTNTGTGVVSFISAVGQGELPWTPVLSFGGSSTGMTYTAQTGTYQVVGRTVTATFTIILTTKGSSTGTAVISGLPLTVADFGSSDTCYSANFLTLSGPVIANAGGTTKTINLYQSSSTGVLLLNHGNFTNTTVLRGTIVYTV